MAILLFLPLLVLELAMSVWYKKEIVAELKVLADESIASTVEFDDIKVSALRNFPQLTISVFDLSIKEKGYEIFQIKKIAFHADLLGFYQDNYSLNKVEIHHPKLYAPIDSTGQKFFIKPNKTQDKSSGVKLLLDIPNIEIRDALIISHNMYKGNKIRIHIDKGDFQLKSFDDLLEFKGDASGTLDTMISKGNLNQTAVPIAAHQATFRINTLDKNKLFDGMLQLHDAQLRAYGLLKPVGTGNLLDITLEGDEARINDYLTLIPQFKPLKLNQLNPDAQLTLKIRNSGFVDPVTFPNIDILFELKNAAFSRIGLPGQVDSVNFRGHFTNGKERNAVTSEMVIDFGRAKVDDSFFEISGFIRNFDDPYIDVKASSEIELEDVNGLMNFPDVDMSGSIVVFADVKGKFSDLEQVSHSNNRNFNGHIAFKDVRLHKKPSNIKIDNLNGEVFVKNTNLSLPNLTAHFNDAKVHISGSTKNFMPIVEQKSGKIALANIAIKVDGLALTQADFVDSQAKKEDETNLEAFEFPKFLNLNCDLKLNDFGYDHYKAELINLKLALNNDSLSIRTGHFKFEEGDLWLGAVSRPADAGGKDYEIWVKANLDHLDTKKYLLPKKKEVKPDTQDPPDYSNFTIHSDLNVKKLKHEHVELDNIRILATLKDDRLQCKTFDFDFPYGKTRSSIDVSLEDSVYVISGSSRIAISPFEIDSIKNYYKKLKPASEHKDSVSSGAALAYLIKDFKLDITAPKTTYKQYEVDALSANIEIQENQVRLHQSSFKMFDGDFSLDGMFQKDDEHVQAFCNISASDIHLGKITSNLGGANHDMFSGEHFKGNIGVQGQVLLSYNHELEHQEDEMLGKINISLSDAEIVKFKPITESLKFIKQANRDTILLTNPNLEILIHNDEIVLPTTTFKTSLSNIEFSGYHNKDFGFGFDLQISVGDLLFKSQKKKRAQVQDDKKATFGAIKHYLEARTVDGQMQIKSLKKRAYREDLLKLENRYTYVDSVLQQMSHQIVQ